VTTRRRKFRVLNSLRSGLDALTALFFGLGMPGFGVGLLAMSGLPPRRLPPADLPLALRLLAVALVPASRLVLASTPLAETNPPARSAPSGRSGARPRTLAGAHGRYRSQGKSSGRMSHHSPRALLHHERAARASLSPHGEQDKERNGFRNALEKETPGSTTAWMALSKRSKLALISRSVPKAGLLELQSQWVCSVTAGKDAETRIPVSRG
jgi:hypothetical protein